MAMKIKDKLKEKINHPCFYAFLFTAFSLLLFLVTTPQLSQAGDVNIAEYLISSKIKPGFFFISPVLAAILRFFHGIIAANWWSIFSVAVMVLGLFIFLWFLNKRYARYDGVVRLFLSGLFVLIFWELILKNEVNFTQTTVIAGLAAILLILDCCYEKMGHSKSCIFKMASGVFLLFLAGAIRWKALVLMAPFAVMCLAYFFLFPYTSSSLLSSIKNSFRYRKKFLLLAAGIVLVIALSGGLHKLYQIGNPDLGAYVESNALREEICDYADRYPAYEESTATMYEERGITQSWITMVCGFLTGDENHFMAEDLRKMAALRLSSHKQPSDFIGSLKGHTLLWIGIVLLFVSLMYLSGRKNAFLPLLGVLSAFLFCGLYFIAIGRIAWRVTNGCILACILSFIAMTEHPVSEKVSRKFDLTAKTGVVALTMLCFVTGCAAVRFEKEFELPRAVTTDEELAGMLTYIDANSDITYLDIEESLRYYNAHNMWSAHEADYLDNSFSLVAHFILGEKETLAARGIHDVVGEMLSRSDIQVRYCSPYTNGVFLQYLRDYYDKCVSVSVVDRYGGTKFLRYASPVALDETAAEGNQNSTVTFEIVDDFADDTAILASIEMTYMSENTAPSYQDYYLNITDNTTGALYSYGLKANEHGCGGAVVWMQDTWKPENISVVLVGQDKDGHNKAIADVTESFLATLCDFHSRFRRK
ncbi:MAG: hypothetical protein NC318_08010 [Blautia sp.]|nr:hypothetical protein [Lachnoclostridium sp.]MCM1211533.1 hypothetical protein [Blautia sp.]